MTVRLRQKCSEMDCRVNRQVQRPPVQRVELQMLATAKPATRARQNGFPVTSPVRPFAASRPHPPAAATAVFVPETLPRHLPSRVQNLSWAFHLRACSDLLTPS